MKYFKQFIEIIKKKPKSILWHFAIGIIVTWIIWFIFWLAGAGYWSLWVGFAAGCGAGCGIEGYQIVHIKWGQSLNDWLMESIMDISEYIIGGATVFFMLPLF